MNTFPSLVSVGLLSAALAAHAPAQEWTRFRGPNGSGVSKATTVPVRWTEKDYNWKVRVGEGSHSTPAVAGGRLYLRTFTHLISLGSSQPRP